MSKLDEEKHIVIYKFMCCRMCDDVCTADAWAVTKGEGGHSDCKAWVDEQLSEMSLKEKIGQLFIHTVAPLQTQRNKTIYMQL